MRSAVVLAPLLAAALVSVAAAGHSGTRTSSYCTRGIHAGQTGTPQPTILRNGRDLNGNRTKLQACDRLESRGSGEIEFNLDSLQPGVDCTLQPGAKVQLAPSKHVLVTFLRATTYCSTKTRWPNGHTFMAGNTPLAGDPLFEATVAANGDAVVRVARGFLLIGPGATSGTPTRGTVVVGPNEQARVPSGLRPEAARPVTTSLQPLLRSDVAAGLPAPQYARPRSRTALRASAVLRRIGRQRAIVVGLGPGLADAGTSPFVRRFFSFLAARWMVRAVFEAAPPARAARLLATGRIDVLVSASPPRRTLTAAFFGDHAGDDWRLAVHSDAVFLRALTTFLQSALDSGDYDRLYRLSLRDEPPVYRSVAPLIFPPAPCSARPKADLTSPLDLSLALSASPSGPILPGATVAQTATVTNVGGRVVDCVTLHLHLFGGVPLDERRLEASGCRRAPAQPGQAADDLELSCELGRFGLGTRKTLRVLVRAAASRHTETCADVDADESGGLPEVNRADNSGCVQLVYRAAPLLVGAADDSVAQATLAASKARLDLLRLAGFDAVVVSAGWTRRQGAVPDPDLLARLANAAEAADLDRIRVFLAVANADPADTPVSAADRAAFAAYAQALARALPTVHDFVVGNEPNNEQFWAPQYRDGRDASPAAYVALLARTYDALKQVDPAPTVIAGALAPRGLDRPVSAGHDSHSPTAFVTLMGEAYHRLRRSRPIMDAFAIHPIPDSPDVSPAAVHPRPSSELGIGDYDTLVSLLARAFDGASFPIYYTEYGVQTATPARLAALYTGTETAVGDLATAAVQASRYRQALALASCQVSVGGIFLFHAFDDGDLERWQSGIYYVDGTPKPSFAAVSAAVKAATVRDVSSCPPDNRIP